MTITVRSEPDGKLAIKPTNPLFINRSSSPPTGTPGEPAPFAAMPESLKPIVAEIAAAHSVPVELSAAMHLMLASSCIGRTRGLVPRNGQVVYPNLFFMVIGKSGMGKSPLIKTIFHRLQELDFLKYQALQDMALKMDSDLDEPTSDFFSQTIVEDITIQALGDAFARSPKGLLWKVDEAAGLLAAFDQIGKPRVLSAYGSEPWRIDRVKHGRQYAIPAATLNILTNVTPRDFIKLFSLEDIYNGLWPRFSFLFFPGGRPAKYNDKGTDSNSLQKLAGITDALSNFDFDVDGKPVLIGLTPEAKALYVKWHNQMIDQAWPVHPIETYDTFLVKAQDRCLRIALALHCLEAVADGKSELVPISQSTMARAIHFNKWLFDQTRCVLDFACQAPKLGRLTDFQGVVADTLLKMPVSYTPVTISTAQMAKLVTKNAGARKSYNTAAVGKALKSFGFDDIRLDGDRSYIIVPEKLEALSSAIIAR